MNTINFNSNPALWKGYTWRQVKALLDKKRLDAGHNYLIYDFTDSLDNERERPMQRTVIFAVDRDTVSLYAINAETGERFRYDFEQNNILDEETGGGHEVELLGGVRAQGTPANLDAVPLSFGGSRIFDGSIQQIAEIYDDDNAYDPELGVWTAPATGRYNLGFYCHYTYNSGNGFYSGSAGIFKAGLCTPIGNNIFVGSSFTVIGPEKHIDISGSIIGLNLNEGTQMCLKCINSTGVNYTAFSGDVVRLEVQRIR
jgi:hypothetical protein